MIPFEFGKMVHKLEIDHQQYLAALKKSEDELIRFDSAVEKSVRQQRGYWGSLAAGVEESMGKAKNSVVSLLTLGLGGHRTDTGQGLGVFDKIKAINVDKLNTIKKTFTEIKDTFLTAEEEGLHPARQAMDKYLDKTVLGKNSRAFTGSPVDTFRSIDELLQLRRDHKNLKKLEKKTARMEDVRSKTGVEDFDTGAEGNEEIQRQTRLVGKNKYDRMISDFEKKVNEPGGLRDRNSGEADNAVSNRKTEIEGLKAAENAERQAQAMRGLVQQGKLLSPTMSEVDKQAEMFAEHLRESKNLTEDQVKAQTEAARVQMEANHETRRTNAARTVNQGYDSNREQGHAEALKQAAASQRELELTTKLMSDEWNEVDRAVERYKNQLEEAHQLNQEEIEEETKKRRDTLNQQHETHREHAARAQTQQYAADNERNHAEALKSAAQESRAINDQIKALQGNWSGVDEQVASYRRNLEQAHHLSGKEIESTTLQRRRELEALEGEKLKRSNEKPAERFKREAEDLARLRMTLGSEFEETYQRQTRKQIHEFESASPYSGPEAAVGGGSQGGQAAAVNAFVHNRELIQHKRALQIAHDAQDKAKERSEAETAKNEQEEIRKKHQEKLAGLSDEQVDEYLRNMDEAGNKKYNEARKKSRQIQDNEGEEASDREWKKYLDSVKEDIVSKEEKENPEGLARGGESQETPSFPPEALELLRQIAAGVGVQPGSAPKEDNDYTVHLVTADIN